MSSRSLLWSSCSFSDLLTTLPETILAAVVVAVVVVTVELLDFECEFLVAAVELIESDGVSFPGDSNTGD